MIARLLIATLLLIGCTATVPSAPPSPKPTTVPSASPTPRPAIATATPTVVALDYVALRNELVQQLSPLIVAMRANDSRTLPGFIARFEQAAQKIEPLIARDMSPNGNRLHSAVVNSREAIKNKDVAELEWVRRLLLLEIK